MSTIIGSFLTGEVRQFAGPTAPVGWLFCYGQTLNASTSPIYQDLFDVIGNTYGGTNNTNFVVPDLRGRSVLGKDNMGGSAAGRLSNTALHGISGSTLGSANGTANDAVTLTASQSGVPAHTHTTPAHSHNVNFTLGGFGQNSPINGNAIQSTGIPGGFNTGDASPTTNNNAAANAASGHSNVGPSIILNFIIKI